MRQYSYFITLAGGCLALFTFALPWKHTDSGAVLANGKGWSITLVFIVLLGIFVTGLYFLNRKPRVNSCLLTLAAIMGSFGFIGGAMSFIQFFERGINIITISFVASLIIIGTTIYMFNRQTDLGSLPTTCVFTSSCVGICCFLILFFSGSFVIGSGVKVDNTRYGAFLTVIGYVLAMVGLFCFPKTDIYTTEPNEEQKNKEQNSEGDDV